mmetsp:Transcript_5789/g.14157  ORF Transcript_5789/g.14157 Transcript_5789/m.14157 type:complete len:308 (+) Transcript_5789:131-1054(+)
MDRVLRYTYELALSVGLERFAPVNERQLVRLVVYCMFATGVATFVLLELFTSPAAYGRYSPAAAAAAATSDDEKQREQRRRRREAARTPWYYGPVLPARVAWMLQEAPSFALPVAYMLVLGRDDLVARPANFVLLSMMAVHYANRTFLYPLMLRGGKGTPALLVLAAFAFCLVNGYVQAVQHARITHYARGYERSPRFLLGCALYVLGAAINVHADTTLRNLRKPGERGYKVPRGGAFRFVSCANYFGELVEWTGYAVASNTLTAAAFAFFTFANTGPRGRAHHRDYHRRFGDAYPRERTAVIPFVY